MESHVPVLGAPSRDCSGLGGGGGEPICFSPFLGALGSSCKKGMLAICWCSELARHPGRALLCQSLVKTLARAAFPMPGVSSGRLGMQPSVWPPRQNKDKVASSPGPRGLCIFLWLKRERTRCQLGSHNKFVEEDKEWAGRTMSGTLAANL